ncbi:hypothetical protein HQ535_06795 [bacterium]|nr:hypothetical protein [bacterium]
MLCNRTAASASQTRSLPTVGSSIAIIMVIFIVAIIMLMSFLLLLPP